MSFFIDALSPVESSSSVIEPPWVSNLRVKGRETYARLGLPSKRNEAWKYTNLQPASQVAFSISDVAEGEPSLDEGVSAQAGDGDRVCLVFHNGRLRPHLSQIASLPDGVRLLGTKEAVEQNHDDLADFLGNIAPSDGKAMQAMNTAMFEDGFTLFVAPNTEVKAPIEIVWTAGEHAGEPTAFFPRNLIVLAAGSRAELIERYVADETGATFANALTEISIGVGASLCHIRQQDEDNEAYSVASVSADVAEGGSYDTFSFSLGTRLSRSDIDVRLIGPDSACSVSGTYMLRHHQHCDNTTVIRHCAPRTRCREVFKGVVDDDAHAVFQGRIVVEKDAQQANGHQLSKAILLSDRAEVDQKPELEISANDVKCSHGAAVGQLDTMGLFYLRSRGIPDAMARRLLIEGFLAEAFDEIADPAIRSEMEARTAKWFDDKMATEQ